MPPHLGSRPPRKEPPPPRPRIAEEGGDKVLWAQHKGSSKSSPEPPASTRAGPCLYCSAPLGGPGGFSTEFPTTPSGRDPSVQGRWASWMTSRTVARKVLLTKQ